MPLYSIIEIAGTDSYPAQVVADHVGEAINIWIKNMKQLAKLSDSDIVSAKEIKFQAIGKNLWQCEARVLEIEVLLYISRTDAIVEATYYNTDDAIKFIYEKLAEEEKKYLTPADIELLNDLEFEYLETAGVAKKQEDGEYLMDMGIEYDEEDLVKYINLQGLKRQKIFTNELISQILDFEYEYMKHIGMVDETEEPILGMV